MIQAKSSEGRYLRFTSLKHHREDDHYFWAMEELIAKNVSTPELLEQAIKDGYVPMREYGWHKVMKGITTVEEVISVTASDLGGEE